MTGEGKHPLPVRWTGKLGLCGEADSKISCLAMVTMEGGLEPELSDDILFEDLQTSRSAFFVIFWTEKEEAEAWAEIEGE